MQVLDKELSDNTTREKQLDKILSFKDLVPLCKEEYVKVPLDVNWNELEKDVPLAFEKFGWYGMIHRSMTTWDRSPYYGGLGLTYNPDYLFDIPKHAQGYGQPRSTEKQDDAEEWVRSLDRADYRAHGGCDLPRGKNTYDDCLGLRERTEASYEEDRDVRGVIVWSLRPFLFLLQTMHSHVPKGFVLGRMFLWQNLLCTFVLIVTIVRISG